MLPEWTSVGFTGHRGLENDEAARAGIARAMSMVGARRSPLVAIASVAAGGDSLFLAEASRQAIPYFALLPFARERFRDTMTKSEWQTASGLLEMALNVEEVTHTESPELAFLETGIRTVDASDVMIALWNGEPARGTGGTAEIVDYARQTRKPLLLVDPVTGNVATENFDMLSERRDESGAGVAPLDAVRQQYEAFDVEATAQRPSFLSIILLHLAAEAFAVIPLVFEWHGLRKQIFSASELVLLVVALFLAIGVRHEHHEWVRSRLGAELCRSFLALWCLRRRGAPLPQLAVPSLVPLQRSLTIAWHLDRSEALDLKVAREEYLKNRVQSQIEYFASIHRIVAPRFRFLRAAATFGTFAAILTAIAGLVISILNPDALANQFLELSTLLLPLASAAILSLVVAEDYMRRSIRYGEMLSLLEQIATRLRMTRTWSGLSRIAVQTEQLLLQEVLEWHSISRFGREPH